MMTKDQVETLRYEIESNIDKVRDQFIDACTQADYQRLDDQRMRLQAQFDILTRVLAGGKWGLSFQLFRGNREPAYYLLASLEHGVIKFAENNSGALTFPSKEEAIKFKLNNKLSGCSPVEL